MLTWDGSKDVKNATRFSPLLSNNPLFILRLMVRLYVRGSSLSYGEVKRRLQEIEKELILHD